MKPEQIQILVDGECSHQERALLLNQLNDDVSSWRALALALLEDKEWTKQICATKHFTTEVETVRKQMHCGIAGAPVQPFVQPRDRSSGYVRPLLSALAASVLVLVGFYGGTIFQKDAPPQFAEQKHNEPNLGVNNMIAANGADGTEGMRILWPNAEGGSIPLYDGKKLDPSVVWAKDETEFNRMNEQLRQRGFELERSPEFYMGTLNDGRRLIIPVNKVDLKPYGY